MERLIYLFAAISGCLLALRYLFFKLMIIPMKQKIAEEEFKAKQRSIAEEFEKYNQEIKDAKIEYDRAKRDALNKSRGPGGV